MLRYAARNAHPETGEECPAGKSFFGKLKGLFDA